MKGVGIFDGDLVVVDRAIEAKPGLIVITAPNNEPLIKTLCKDGEQPHSENATFAARYIFESDELLIWGVVLYSIHSHTHARA